MNKLFASTILGTMLLGVAIPVFAEYAPRKVDLACMKTAVGKREDAIIVAKEKAFASMDASFKTRKDALKLAWDKTNPQERKIAINDAWKAFQMSQKTARTQLRTEDKSAWSTFKTDSKACKVDSASTETDRKGEKVDRDTL